MFARHDIHFRALAAEDVPLLYRWLRNPAVAQWYGPTPENLAELERKYGPRIAGDEAVQCFIVEYAGQPAGFIQTYRIQHEPEYAAALDVDPAAVGVDIFIGKDDFRHRGFGPIMLQEFVQRVVFVSPDVSCCVIGPDVNNQAAIRSYSKAGFKHIKTVAVPGEPEPEYVMVLNPGELPAEIKRLDQERSS